MLSGKGIGLVQLRPSREQLVPGNNYTFVFKVFNSGSNGVELTSALELPQNWRDLTNERPFQLEPGNEDVRLISVNIPSMASPGDYRIKYSVWDVTQSDSIQIVIPVTVAAVTKLKASLLNAPSYVLAGDVIQSYFSIENQGNISEMVQLHTEQCRAEGDSVFEMAPSSVRTIRVLSSTNKQHHGTDSRFMQIVAHVQGNEKENASAFSMVRVIPAVEQPDDAYFRFPVKLSVSYIGRQNNGVYSSGFQGEISGQGNIDQSGKRQMEFKALGPNQFNMAGSGQFDEYFAAYKSTTLSLHVGDKSFCSTPLTEYARYGRGIDVLYQSGKIELGGFLNAPRFYSDIKKEYMAYAGFNPNTKIHVQTGYFAKEVKSVGQTAQLYSVSTWVKPFKQVRLEAEYSQGKVNGRVGDGLIVKGELGFKKASLSFMYLKSGEFYPGYYSNTSLASANMNIHLTKKLNLNLNYQQDALNPKQDTLFGAAPLSNSYQAGLSYQHTKGGIFSLFGGSQERQDRMLSSLFHYKEEFIRASELQQFRRFSFSMEGGLANSANLLTGKRGTSWNVSADVGYVKDRNVFNIFANYQNSARYEASNVGQLIYGCRMSMVVRGKTQLQMSFQNDYSIEEYYRDRSILNINLKQYVGSRSYFDLIGNYALIQKQVGKKDFSMALRYTVELNVPVKRIADFAELSGVIKKNGADNIEGIRLFCNGHTAITDSNGSFKFRNLKPGKYYLLIDQSTIGVHDIPDVKQPMEIEVASGQNEFAFGLTHSAKIVGYVVLRQENMQLYEHTSDDELGKENVVVEITDGVETYRKLVCLESDFVFDNLRPGEWSVRIYRNSLSESYQIETSSFVAILKSGGVEKISVLALKKSKEIKFLQQSMKISYNGTPKNE